MHSLLTRAWVEVDLGALLRNGARVVEHTGARLLPMVKADAYGLGAHLGGGYLVNFLVDRHDSRSVRRGMPTTMRAAL